MMLKFAVVLVGMAISHQTRAATGEGDGQRIQVVLSLREKIETAAGEVYLEDVAECQSRDPEVCDAIGGIRLLQALVPGTSLQLGPVMLREIIAKDSGEITAQFVGSDTVSIISAVNTVDQRQIEDHLKRRLEEITQGWERMRFSIRRLRILDKVVSRDDQYHVVIPALDGGLSDAVRTISDSVGGWLMVEARIEDQDWVQPFRLHAQVDLEVQTPVAVRDLERGALITAADVGVKWMRTNRFGLADMASLADLAGKVLARPLREGEPMRKSFVKKPMVIARGKTVKVKVGSQGVALTSDAKALQAGGIGDDIEVLIIPTKKKLMAKVLDAETVEGKF